ncbi:MAG TPA: SRPBCC family protein [Pseudonocardiaceae bacterium]|jgi:uncharacterized protein YndB with AHSA1/START domain|nr:SRPBCC family protein [Pseudonocardiaceae bacterium]
MPSFDLSARTEAPLEEVWKLLHDPARFPEWWAGVETVRTQNRGDYTMWPTGFPDFPMAQRMRTDHADGRVMISCLVSDLEFRWQLHADGDTTGIEVHVDLPETEAHRLEIQRALLTESINRLAELARRPHSARQ